MYRKSRFATLWLFFIDTRNLRASTRLTLVERSKIIKPIRAQIKHVKANRLANEASLYGELGCSKKGALNG